MIAKLWAKKIIEGAKTFDEVPTQLKEQVRDILIENGYDDLVV